MKIRKATKKDIRKIAKVWIQEYSKKPYYEKWSLQSSQKRVKDYFDKKYIIYVAAIEKEIIGFIIFEICPFYNGSQTYIADIAVLSNNQGNGVGKSLMKKAESESRKRGAKKISLRTSKKSRAFGFYKKLNYNEEKDFVNLDKKLR